MVVGETLKQTLPFFRRSLKVLENIFDEDHGRIHDDAKIHRAHRKQIGALAHDHKKNRGEKQREWNIDPDDDCAAEIAEKNPLDEKDQQASENQVVQNGVRGNRD
jgi:hypothetical protein